VIREENGQNFLIATAEKAICDTLYRMRGIENVEELKELILSDWRVDKDELEKLNLSVLKFLTPLYKRKTCYLFLEWLSKEVIK